LPGRCYAFTTELRHACRVLLPECCYAVTRVLLPGRFCADTGVSWGLVMQLLVLYIVSRVLLPELCYTDTGMLCVVAWVLLCSC